MNEFLKNCHKIPSYSYKTYMNIIGLSTPTPSKSLFPSGFQTETRYNLLFPPFVPHNSSFSAFFISLS